MVGVWLQREPIAVVQGGRPVGVGCDVALMSDERREEEQLQLGQLLSDAAPFAQREDEHAAGQVLVQSPVRREEPQRVESVGVVPHFGVVVHGPLVDEDHGVLGDREAADGGVRGGGVRDGEGHEAGEAHDLVDESHDVRQVLLILDGREAITVHDFVHLLLETLLHLREPDEDEDDPLQSRGQRVLARAEHVRDGRGDQVFLRGDPGAVPHVVQRHDERVGHVADGV